MRPRQPPLPPPTPFRHRPRQQRPPPPPPPPVQARARAAGWCYPVGCQRCILETGPARTHAIIMTCSYPSRQRRARQARSTGTGPAPAAQGPSGTVTATYGLVLPREKTCTSPFWGASGSACQAQMEEGMRGTSSVLVIERALPWRACRPKYGHVKVARLKRENAVSDTQISDIGTREDNQNSKV